MHTHTIYSVAKLPSFNAKWDESASRYAISKRQARKRYDTKRSVKIKERNKVTNQHSKTLCLRWTESALCIHIHIYIAILIKYPETKTIKQEKLAYKVRKHNHYSATFASHFVSEIFFGHLLLLVVLSLLLLSLFLPAWAQISRSSKKKWKYYRFGNIGEKFYSQLSFSSSSSLSSASPSTSSSMNKQRRLWSNEKHPNPPFTSWIYYSIFRQSLLSTQR